MYTSLLVVAMLIAYFLCTVNSELSLQAKLNQNVANNKLYKCKTPQPRVFRHHDVIVGDDKPTLCEVVIPPVTVLHRCDFEAGCCSESHRSCQPIKTEEVTLTFQAFFRNTGNCKAATRSKLIRFVQTTAVNHTECACLSNNNLPK